MSAQAILDEVNKLQPTLGEWEKHIESKLRCGVPRVTLQFPRITPDMLGASELTNKAGAMEEARCLLDDGLSIEDCRVEAEAKMSQATAFLAVLVTQLGALALSLVVGIVSLIFFEVDSIVGPLVTTLMAALNSMLSLKGVLESRTSIIFEGMQQQLDCARGALVNILNVIDEHVMAPVSGMMDTVEEVTAQALAPLGEVKNKVNMVVEHLVSVEFPVPDTAVLKEPLTKATAQVDALVAQATLAASKLQDNYKDDLKKISAAEVTIRRVKPDFDVPDPSDLIEHVENFVKKPLDAMIAEAETSVDVLFDMLKPPFEKVNQARDQLKGVVSLVQVPTADRVIDPLKAVLGKIKSFIKKAKAEVPTKMTQLLASTTPGLLMTSRWHFNMAFVTFPLAIVFLFNLPTAICVALHAAESVQKQLQTIQEQLKPTEGPPAAGWLPHVPRGMEMQALEPYYMPAVASLMMVVTQFLLTLLLTAKVFACKIVNWMIGSFEAKLNAEINQRVDKALGKVFQTTFDAVGVKVKALTGAFKDAITQVDSTLKSIVVVEHLFNDAMAAKELLMKGGHEIATKVETVIEEEKNKLIEKERTMEQRIKDSAALVKTMKNPAEALKRSGGSLKSLSCFKVSPRD